MLDIFSGLRLVVKRRSISIDNAIFRCHWFFTSTLLVSFSLVITARQYVGQPIECHSIDKIPDSLLNSYCWVQSTFSLPQACNLNVGSEVPYPCIDNTRGREVRIFAYYQWVGMVLFIQGLLFHLPYYLWKVWENGLIKAITGGLRIAVLSDQERAKKKDIVVEYIHDHLGGHKRYALKYFLCEFICLINLIGQLWATNKFFDGQFLRYGLDVLEHSSLSASGQFGSADVGQTSSSSSTSPLIASNSSSSTTTLPANLTRRHQQQQQSANNRHPVDPMTYIFPRMTKCTYYDFGSSGDVQKHDALCLLPLNIINEKIYIALWFWFIVLALLTLIVIIGRLCAICSEKVRCMGLVSRCRLSKKRDIKLICRYCDVGDWFLFYMVAENLDPLIMREIVADIARKIEHQLKLKSELGPALPVAGMCFETDDGAKKLPNVRFAGFRRGSLSFEEDCPLLASASSRRSSTVAGADNETMCTYSEGSRRRRHLSNSLSDLRSTDPNAMNPGLELRQLQPLVAAGQPIAYETLYEDGLSDSSGNICYRRRASLSIEESTLANPNLARRNSLADDCLVAPICRQLKKRFYSRRNRSYDLNELRQRLFEQQPPFNPYFRYQQSVLVADEPLMGGHNQQSLYQGDTTSGFNLVSAPPISLMPLVRGSPTNRSFLHRRGSSLSRMGSLSKATASRCGLIVDLETGAGGS